MSTYAERFEDALRAELPDTFTVYVEATICAAYYGTAALVGFTPNPEDKRQAVTPEVARGWIVIHTGRLRSQMHHYTPEAKEAATALLEALEAHKTEVSA